MSKQSENKEFQGYTTELKNCGNCARMVFDMRAPAWILKGEYSDAFKEGNKQEAGHRCSIGSFAVKKTASCKLWEPKQ